MTEDIKKLVSAFTDPGMTREGRASVLAYARGRLDAQKELKATIGSIPAKAENPEQKPNGGR